MSAFAKQVLIAEDHLISRELLERKLSSWGYSTVTARDGEEALAILESDHAPSLAILDWMMPKMDGIEICTRVREHGNKPYIYLILLTGKSNKDDIANGLKAGADDYVIKPFDTQELRARLKVGERLVGLERSLAGKIADLESTLADVRELRAMLPLCMYCKSVRDDQDYWHTIDTYVHQETGTDFSHGICPDCLATLQAAQPWLAQH